MDQSFGAPSQSGTLDVDQSSIRDLLSAQLDLVEKALEFNILISRRLGETEEIRGSEESPPPRLAKSKSSIKEVQFNDVILETHGETDVRPVAAKSPASLQENSIEEEIPSNSVRNRGRAHSAPAEAAAEARFSVVPRRRAKTEQDPCPKTHYIGEEDFPTDSENSFDLGTPLMQKRKKNLSSQKRRSSMFGDTATLKMVLKNSLTKEDFKAELFYKERGFWVAVSTNRVFGNLTLVVIFLNTIYIAVSTDCNKADVLPEAPPLFQILDNCFCGFFFFEILARFMSFKNKVDCFKDGWFGFDFLLVALMVWETWIITFLYVFVPSANESSFHGSSIFRSLRLFRLLRATRVVRLLRFWPELMVLVQAMFGGMRSVTVTLCLLFLVIYVFAIVFTQLLSGDGAMNGIFDTVLTSINTLLKLGVFPDQADVLDKMLDLGLMYYVLFVIYLGIGVLTVMNLLIGVLCEVVTEVAQVEKEALLANDIRAKLYEACPLVSLDDSKIISRHELQEFLTDTDVARHLVAQNVNVQALVDHVEFMFKQGEELNIDSFIDIVLEFRGGALATARHIAELQKSVTRSSFS